MFKEIPSKQRCQDRQLQFAASFADTEEVKARINAVADAEKVTAREVEIADTV